MLLVVTHGAYAEDPNPVDPNVQGKTLVLLQSIRDASAVGQAMALSDNAGCRFLGQVDLSREDSKGSTVSLLDQGIGGGTWSIDIHQQNCKGVVTNIEWRVPLRNVSAEHGYNAGDVVEAYPKP